MLEDQWQVSNQFETIILTDEMPIFLLVAGYEAIFSTQFSESQGTFPGLIIIFCQWLHLQAT